MERGTAIVELALVCLPLVLLVFGAIDFGRMAQFQNRVTNAAREGSVLLAVHPGWVQAGCNGDRNVGDRTRNQDTKLASNSSFRVNAYRGTGPFTTANEITGCTVGFPTGVTPGSKVTVVVSVRVQNTSPLTSQFLGSAVLIRRSSTVTVQG